MPGTNENNLDAYNEVATTLGGAGGHLNDMVAVRAIAVLEGVSGGPADISDDNMALRLNAIDVGAGGAGGHLNTLDALNSIVVLKGGAGGHFNDLDAINEWIDFVFSGPLDDLPATLAAYSIARRLLSSYSGPLIRLRRDSDNAESDFTFDANGDLDTAAIVTFLGAANGFFTTVYAQDGAANFLQATAGSQPQYLASGIGTRPAALYVRANSNRLRADITEYTDTTLTYCHLMHCVSNPTNSSSLTLLDSSDTNDSDSIRSAIAAYMPFITLDLRVFRAANLSALTRPGNGVDFQRSVVFDGVNCVHFINQSTSASSASSGAFAIDRVYWGCRFESSAPAQFFDGREVELALFSSDLSTADRETFENNQAAYYGTP